MPGVCAGGRALEPPRGRPVKLGAPEHFLCLALRRVNAGGVARPGDGWLRDGRPRGVVLAGFLGVLLAEGPVEVGDPSPQDGLSRVRLSGAGQARYSQLCREQRRRDDSGVGAR